jgi:dolichyl-phosphate-mannose-protein mannosyltransferase
MQWNRFDEVHFGKFAAYYILREYYFDVHPPFAKLLLGLAGWFVGFDGKFEFEAIGDSYSEHHIPYIGMRSMPAIFGSLTVTIVYQIMKECGFPVVVCSFTALLIAIGKYRSLELTVLGCELRMSVDNGHICQTRLILLDAALVFFVALTLYAYVRFRKVRYLYVFSSQSFLLAV